MPLDEQQRAQLDSIVSQMVANGEPDDAIQFVVGDFRTKYDAPVKEELGSGGASFAAMTARSIPAIVQGGAQFAADHPAVMQKGIGAAITAGASAIGGAIGGIPGAMGGGMIRGITPSQAAIRETAGRMIGETPAAAKDAGRAMGVVNYARETAGLKLKPTDLVSTGKAASAVDNFATSNGQKIIRLFGPDNKMVVGPEVASQAAKRTPGIVRQAASKTAGAVGKVLSPISAMTGVTDFAQTVEPTRRDIGVAGIGRSQPDPTSEELTNINARNTSAMNTRVQQQDQQRAELVQRILQILGLR